MNERIRELALQANPASKEIYESDNWEYNCAAWCAQDLEKFAELIVRECADVGSKFSLAHPEAIRYQIKKHFGVKE